MGCALAFTISCAVYWSLLYAVLRHEKSTAAAANRKPYESAQARLRYDYFNTNPVYVLMSEHLPKLRLPQATWYEAGKAYLQTHKPLGEAGLDTRGSSLEFPPDMWKPRFGVDRLLYDLRVWFTGAPRPLRMTVEDVLPSGGPQGH